METVAAGDGKWAWKTLLWNWRTGETKEMKAPKEDHPWGLGLAFAGDNQLCWSTEKGDIILWNLDKGEEELRVRAGRAWGQPGGFSPDGRHFIVRLHNSGFVIVDVNTKRLHAA